MGIKIEKPSIYLGAEKLDLYSFAKKYKEVITKKIGSRYIHIEEKKNILEMSIEVCKKIIKYKKKIKFLIFVSQGQDYILPSCAEELAQKLGLNKNTFVISLSSGCSGFVQALHTANNFLNKINNCGLIVCAEKYSKYISGKDFKTRVLFSDAASATIVKFANKKNILETDFGFDGINSSALQVHKKKNLYKLEMDGNKIFLFGVNNIPDSIKKVSIDKKIKIDKYLIHNGSKFLIDTLCQRIPNSKKKILTSFHVTGNTVSSSIPLLINIYYKKLKSKNVILSGFGVGLSWATILISWL
jgi:3-oxoacyl-[acyl-carrier-protein] synthase III